MWICLFILHIYISNGLLYNNQALFLVLSVGSSTNSSLQARSRLQTTASSEIQLCVAVGSKTFSLLTSPLIQVHSLKAQIEEISGVPADCQLLRLDGKPLVMNKFLLGDYHIKDNSTIYVQVHPWNEEYVQRHYFIIYIIQSYIQ